MNWSSSASSMASASDTSSPDRCAIARSLIQNASRYKRLLLAENRLLLKSCVTWAKIWASWMPVDTTFYKAINKVGRVCVAYIVTDDDRRFQAVARRLPGTAEPVFLRRPNNRAEHAPG